MADADRPPRRFRQVIDALVYAVAVTSVVFLVGGALSFSLGRGLVGVKYVLFLVGLLLFGYATFQLRPSQPWDVDRTGDGVEIVRNDDRAEAIGSRKETRFQAAVQRIPPLTRYSIPPEERLPAAVKLFLTSIAVLGTSFAMEAVFGVGV
ncbi:DUF7555 family protein [Haladaptatus salinisoli]|uniref:DUF7555 family protein n=1 Tax=Haladaptatus salinisoli TaxID=2884876 RepID=UPI001D0B0733|nr:hypothetical protein [Haladaptatus salinisoli]